MTHPFFAGTRHPRIFAHRGLASGGGSDSAVWENTAGAFAAAHAAGAEFIESDCQVTADGHVVLFHDDTLLRVTGDPRGISDVRLRELEEIFADHGGLVTVADALSSFPESRFNIDVKTVAAAEPIGSIVAPHVDRVLLTSFSDANRRAALEAVRRAGATGRPATSGGKSIIARARALSALRLSPAGALRDIDALQIPEKHAGIRILTPQLIRAAHANDVEVHVWTVNEPDDMRRLVGLGVDGIITDHADVAIDALG